MEKSTMECSCADNMLRQSIYCFLAGDVNMEPSSITSFSAVYSQVWQQATVIWRSSPHSVHLKENCKIFLKFCSRHWSILPHGIAKICHIFSQLYAFRYDILLFMWFVGYKVVQCYGTADSSCLKKSENTGRRFQESI